MTCHSAVNQYSNWTLKGRLHFRKVVHIFGKIFLLWQFTALSSHLLQYTIFCFLFLCYSGFFFHSSYTVFFMIFFLQHFLSILLLFQIHSILPFFSSFLSNDGSKRFHVPLVHDHQVVVNKYFSQSFWNSGSIFLLSIITSHASHCWFSWGG